MIMKKCRACNKEKSMEFYYFNKIKNVYLADCKECTQVKDKYMRYLKKHKNDYIYKKCKTHGVLEKDKIIVCDKIKNNQIYYFLRCLTCSLEYRITAYNEKNRLLRISENKLIKCVRCKIEKFHNDYWDTDLRAKHCRCIKCRIEMHQQHRQRVGVSHRLNVTKLQYDLMLEKQSHVCLICKNPEKSILKGKIKNLAIDHCHSSGKIRGLLCQKCNQGLGIFSDNPILLRQAANYLEQNA